MISLLAQKSVVRFVVSMENAVVAFAFCTAKMMFMIHMSTSNLQMNPVSITYTRERTNRLRTALLPRILHTGVKMSNVTYPLCWHKNAVGMSLRHNFLFAVGSMREGVAETKNCRFGVNYIYIIVDGNIFYHKINICWSKYYCSRSNSEP